MFKEIKEREYLNCLRIQIVPNHFEKERINSILEFCKKYHFKNVMLFINAEEYNVGHMTIEEAKPWVETMKRAKKVFVQNGISVSLNSWMELGHLDMARKLKTGQNFTNMVSMEGVQADVVACPLDKEWKKYFFEFYSYLINELEPEVVWIEDDFRLHNHGENLKMGGCFCPLHMAEFNRRLHKNYTREEFVERLFGEKADKEVRDVWLQTNRDTFNDLAKEIGDHIYSLGKNTKVGLMSSGAVNHCLEGRDWEGISQGLMQNNPFIHRLNLPCYSERSAKEYMFDFNCSTMAVREFIGRDSLVYPEMECGSFSTFNKDARFLGFQVETALPLCVKGMTYDIFEFSGNGAVDEYGYGEAVKERMPYLNGVLNLGIDYNTLDGILFPIDEKTAWNRATPDSLKDMYPTEFYFIGYFSAFGITCRYTNQKTFKNKIIALTDGSINNFTLEQLIDVFANNFVILDGNGAIELCNRGLGYLAGIQSSTVIPTQSTLLSYEESIEEINGIKGRRCTALARAGDYVLIDYIEGATKYTKTYTNTGEFFGNGITVYKNVLILPFTYNQNALLEGIGYGLFNSVRVETIKNILRKTRAKLIISSYAGVCCYRYTGQKDKLILVNSTLREFDKIELDFVNVNPKQIWAVDRKTGELKKMAFSKTGARVVIEYAMKYLETATFLIEKEDGETC